MSRLCGRAGIVALVALLAGCLCAGAARAAPARATTAQAPADFTEFACDALELPVSQGIGYLAERALRGGIDPSLATDIVVKVAFTRCPVALPKLWSLVGGFLRRPAAPTPPVLSKYSLYLGSKSLAELSEGLSAYRSTLAAPLGASGTLGFVDRLCADAKQGRSPLLTLESTVPNADARALTLLNATLGLARTRCSLAAWQLSYLTSGVTSYVISNHVNLDVSPPFGFIANPTFGRQLPNGTWPTTVHWSGFDPGSEISRYELWLRSNSLWRRIGFFTSTFSFVVLKPGYSVQFALRAIDNAGNYGAYSYSASYRT
jgi:hypothetical protein